MNKTSLLELAKKLNIPRRNCMKTKEELEEVIKDTITVTKRLFLGQIPRPVWYVWMNLENNRSLIKKCMIKS